MFSTLKQFFNALKSGEQLADAIRAKQWALALTYGQVSIMAVVGVLRAFDITFGSITDEQINVLLGGMVTAGTAIIGMLGVASTDKIGISGRATPAADGEDGRVAELSSVESGRAGGLKEAFRDAAASYDRANPKAPLPNEPRAKNPNPADDSNAGGA
jgi:hypothetical protein